MRKWMNKQVCNFLFYPEDDCWLTLFRAGLGIQVVLYCLSLRSSWESLFGSAGTGVLGSETSEALLRAQGIFAPSLGWLLSAGRMLGLAEATVLELVWIFLLAAGGFLIIGFYCRGAAITAWLLHLCLAKSGGFVAYGLDSAMTIGLFYLMLAPLPDRGALDFWQCGITPRNQAMLGFFRRLVQVHLCVIYFFGGLTKMLGSGWWTGDSLWRALIRPPFDVLPAESVARWHPVLPALGVSVWAIELLYCVFIWPRRTRTFWLALVVALHCAVAIGMGMYLFSLTMIVLNVAAFGSGWRSPHPAAVPADARGN